MGFFQDYWIQIITILSLVFFQLIPQKKLFGWVDGWSKAFGLFLNTLLLKGLPRPAAILLEENFLFTFLGAISRACLNIIDVMKQDNNGKPKDDKEKKDNKPVAGSTT